MFLNTFVLNTTVLPYYSLNLQYFKIIKCCIRQLRTTKYTINKYFPLNYTYESNVPILFTNIHTYHNTMFQLLKNL